MTVAGASALELVLQSLPGRVGLHWLDAAGAVERHVGFDDGTAIAPDDGRLRITSEPERRHLVLGPDAPVAVATWDAGAGEATERILRSLGQWFGDTLRLESDVAAMSDSAAYYLEVISLIDETLPQLGSGESEADIARMCLEQLVVAAGLEHALFVRFETDRPHAEVLVYLRMAEDQLKAVVQEYPFDPVLPRRAGLVGRAAAGPDSGIMLRVDDPDFVAEPDSPEALARQAIVAIPVRYGTGAMSRTLGVVLAIDRSRQGYGDARDLGSEQRAFTNSVACMLGTVLGTRHAAELTKELETANQIQDQIRPPGVPVMSGYDLAGGCLTCGEVGGDYYDFVATPDGSLCAIVADVSGHNLASGMIMVSARAALRVLAERTESIEALFTELNRALHDDLVRTERFVSATGLRLRPDEANVQIANAGHLDTIVWRAAMRTVQRIPGTDPILGFLPDVQFARREIELRAGDVLVLITDGIVEAVGADQEMFGMERLERWLARNADGSASEILAGIFQAVDDFTPGTRRADDISALVVKADGPG
jgi:hypothetical protein